jgi:hypothetical protein
MVLGAVAASSLSAQANAGHPDLSGIWVMDPARSDSSSFTPAGAVYVVTQGGDTLAVDRRILATTGDTIVSHMVWGWDGATWTNTLPLIGTDVETRATASWHGDTLVVHSTAMAGGSQLVQDDGWMLAADGTLRIHRMATYAGRSLGSPTLVFVRRR